MKANHGDLLTDGIQLLSVTKPVGLELYRNQMSARALGSTLKELKNLLSDDRVPLEYLLDELKQRGQTPMHLRGLLSSKAARQIGSDVTGKTTLDEFKTNISQAIAQTRQEMEELEKRETKGVLSAFAGDTTTPPAYAEWLMQQFGNLPFLHIKETKRLIGREEAETLLQLKVKRGGPDRLQAIQRTVGALLGVEMDAFQGEGTNQNEAEMDVDNFLVEANGAGIREALRIILDLELKNPTLVLIEEPEVHLHPGLSRVIAGYLREKSQDIQMFITTHSTEFVDSVSFQNVYLVSRDSDNKTTCDTLNADEGVSKIPAELGLRLSTLFMYDRLVFVESPADEVVFRVLAQKLEIDFTKSNVGFIYMNGVRNFAHYAAEATLDLLSRRRIRMWFVTDRDEQDSEDIKAMVERLAGCGKLLVLARRELENYLLDQSAVKAFIEEKQKISGSDGSKPDSASVTKAIREVAESLKDEVIRLRLKKRLLAPIFFHTRNVTGSNEERLDAGIKELRERIEGIQREEEIITAEVEKEWPTNAPNLAPGSLIIQGVARHFGVTFSRDGRDSERLARHLPVSCIEGELKDLLQDIGGNFTVNPSAQ